MIEIILCNPFINKGKSLKKIESVGELIENIFPISSDHFCLVWNNIEIHLSYKYDLSVIFDDFVYIYKFLESTEKDLQIFFPSNTFDVRWDIEKNDAHILISSYWNTVLSHNEKLLNENAHLKITSSSFKKELSKLLRFIYDIIIDIHSDIEEQLFSDLLENKPFSLNL